MPGTARTRVRRWAALIALATLAACSDGADRADGVGDEPGAADHDWSADIWFGGDDIDRDEFVADELSVLLGEPDVALVRSGVLAAASAGLTTYMNPVGEAVPLIVEAPGGERWTGELGDVSPGRGTVIALHQTNDVGGDEPCGPRTADLAYGTAFATAGYLVVCPTLSFTGARQPADTWNTDAFYASFPGWSAMGKDVTEVAWLLDALDRSGVPTETVAVVGHSQGAIYALYAAAVDTRVDVVVANAGFVDTATDVDPDRWSRGSWYRAFPEQPVGLDYLEVVAAVAPRCALVVSYEADPILEPSTPSPERLHAFEARFPTIDWLLRPGGHAWPTPTVDAAIGWLDGSWDRCPN